MSESTTISGDTVDKCPYEYYAEARAREKVTWRIRRRNGSPPLHAVREVLTDKTPSPDLCRPNVRARSPGAIVASHFSLVGEERLEHRRWWLTDLQPREIERYRCRRRSEIVEATTANRSARARRAVCRTTPSVSPDVSLPVCLVCLGDDNAT